MTLEENLEDLVRHSKDFHERRGFTYSSLEGNNVIGDIYIYPVASRATTRKSAHGCARVVLN